MRNKHIGAAALSAVALLAFAASSASATTLETGGVKRESVTVTKTLRTGTSIILKDTSGAFANTCTSVHEHWDADGFTLAKVGLIRTSTTISKCTEEPIVVDTTGTGSIEWISGTTNGTVRSVGAKFTSPSPYGSLTCTTAASPGTDMGTLTGVAAGNATMDINAVLNCGFFLPSAKLEGSLTVTSPTGLGVTS
jgi:hypothetical protein